MKQERKKEGRKEGGREKLEGRRDCCVTERERRCLEGLKEEEEGRDGEKRGREGDTVRKLAYIRGGKGEHRPLRKEIRPS